MKPNTPEFSYGFALTFNRVLNVDERLFTEQIIGYLSRQVMKMPSGETPDFDWLWNGQAVVVYLDTTKTYSDDISDGFDALWEKLPVMLSEGSPIRTTNRAGLNTKGTRLIEPIGLDAEITNIFSDDEGEELEVLVDIALEASGAQIPFKPESSNPNDVFGVPPAPQMRQIVINVPVGSTVTITVT